MRRVVRIAVNVFSLLAPILLVTPCLPIVAFAQQLQPPPYGDKPIDGGKSFDDMNEVAKRFEEGRSTRFLERRVVKGGTFGTPKADREIFSSFLRAPNTGLMRLLSPETVVNDVRRSPIGIRGGGAQYSFANITHYPAFGVDIQLQGGQLSASMSGLGYGFIANLGDVALDKVTLSAQRTKFISEYSPAVTFPEARAEIQRFRAGATVDGVLYQQTLPIQMNATYLLRSINYGKWMFVSNTSPGTVGIERNTDLLVALRIVRIEENGGIVIAWKLLNRYPSPKIK